VKVSTRKRYAALAVLVLATLPLGARAQVEPHYAELPNFHRVNQQLYRGGQPKAGGLQRLKDLGVKTVVNLRGEDDHARAESQEAQSLGLRYYAISLPEFSKPKDEEVERVLDIINDPNNQPVFIHCHHGKDRTGTIVACYRISHDGWTAEQAKDEARRYGLSWIEFGMMHYIEQYYLRYKAKHDATRSRSIENQNRVVIAEGNADGPQT
jgi:tyrosine-protein phosphatase SIW14